jgi:hypothetical protein
MTVDVDLYKYDYQKLFNALKGLGATDEAKLGHILLTFGFRFGDVYIILCDEHAHEDYNSYYNLGAAIDKAFGLDGSFDPICDMGELLEAHKTIEDAL